MGQYEVRHQCDMKCPNCVYFDYDYVWDGEEERGFFTCEKEHDDHIGWQAEPCEDFKINWTRK